MSEGKWNTALENDVLRMRSEGATYAAIGEKIGKTATSVKHKVRRLQQDSNMDRYRHTREKSEQIRKYIKSESNILELHCAFGGLSEFYNLYGEVESYDIKKDRVDFVNGLGLEGVVAQKADSELEVIRLLANKCKYDVVDIDPYGLPSRYFPYVFGLIDDGLLFLTFPMMGVAQINKITTRHYEALWGISLSDKDIYVEKIIQRLKDYAFAFKCDVSVLDVVRINRVYRFAIKVEKKSMLDIVGLKVNRNPMEAAL